MTLRACVDVGATKVSVCLNLEGTRDLLARRQEPTTVTGPPEALAHQIARMVDDACVTLGAEPAGVRAAGIAACGPFIETPTGIALAAPNLCGGLGGAGRGLPNDWANAPLGAPLAARFDRIRVENDAVAALEAERRWGALRGSAHCAYVTWSTGIGVGLCVDGRVLRGKNGNAGHAGHSFVSDDAQALCGCGNTGDVEALAGGASIARRLGAGAAELLGGAQAGDPMAQAQVDELCRVMGRMLFNLVATLDLERISLGGSVFWNHRDYLLPRLQHQVSAHLQPLTLGCTLVAAGLGQRVGDYAALALLD